MLNGRGGSYLAPFSIRRCWERLLNQDAHQSHQPLATPRCGDEPPHGLIEGIALFNAGEYFECHEVLEDIWRREQDPVRALYQGILQIGVAFHHLRRDNWRGAVKLLSGGSEKIERFVPSCMSVDTESLCDASRRCLALLRELGPERVREFDWTLVPRIQVGGHVPGRAAE